MIISRTLVLVGAAFLIGCASQPPAHITAWTQALADSYENGMTKNDISRMLNTPPYRCEPSDAQTDLGFSITKNTGLRIAVVRATGPAAKAGMQAGEILQVVNSKPMIADIDFGRMLSEVLEAGPDQPVNIVTSRGSYSYNAKFPKISETCYWEYNAGQVSSLTGYSSVNAYGGSGGLSGSSRQSFFRVNCDLSDGMSTGRCNYSSQW